MPALLGVLLSCVTLVSGSAGAGASAQLDICASGAGVCVDGNDLLAESRNDDGNAFATPAVVDCNANGPGRTGDAAIDVTMQVAGCDLPSFDFRYRVSRFPDSERPSGGLGPQRARQVRGAAVTCEGLPPDHGGLTSASVPPLAIYAIGRLTPPSGIDVAFESEQSAPSRVVEPLERPPRL